MSRSKFVNKTRKKLLRILGLQGQAEEINTLYYFLDHYTDITKLKTTDPQLRDLQDGCIELLLIFHNVCERHHLTYWLDYGTLLGAIRHQDFIPWDDDLDVAMPREDYNRLVGCCREELKPYGIRVGWGGHFDSHGPMSRLAVEYKALQTGAWLDVFPVDHIFCDSKADYTGILLKDNIRYKQFYQKNEARRSPHQLLEMKNKIYSNIPRGNHEIYFHGKEFPGMEMKPVFEKEDLFPLALHTFGKYRFYVPRNCDLYLRSVYGDGYMSYPRGGLEHHTDPDGHTASSRAERTGTDMKEVISYLHGVAEQFEPS